MSAPLGSSRFEPYESIPSTGSRPSSSIDLNSYFTEPLSVPHRLPGGYPASHAPYRSSMEAPNMQQAEASPFLTPSRNSGGLASSKADTGPSLGGDEARRSQASMIGLGSTPTEPPSNWLQNEVKHQKRNRLLFISACLGTIAVIVVAIVVGVYFGTKRNNNLNSSASSNSDNNGNTPPTASDGPALQDPNDPSNFTKDPKLKNAFYGIAYTMRDSLYPSCNQTLRDTIIDMQLISQLTTRIRLYGADCNQTALVLEAIKQTKTNIKVYPAIYLVEGDETAYQRQKTLIQQALQTYGTDHILGITVGNEFMLNYLTAHGGGSNVNGTAGLAASALLKAKITDIRQMLQGMSITLPVGTSDAGAYFNNDLLGAVDYGMSNVHAWFAGTTIQDSANWTFTFFQQTNVDVANALANKPQMYIAETGWPTFSSTAAEKTDGASEASEPNLQIFMDTFVCSANTRSVKYFYFEFTDIPWKERQFPGVEGFWGLFYNNKTLKAVTIPDCTHE